MIEVELRAKADLGVVEKRLKALGAKFAGAKRDVDSYYSLPGRPRLGLGGKLKGMGVARIRFQEWTAGKDKGGKKVFVTVKTLPGESHAVRVEREVLASDEKSAAQVLESLGCKKVLVLDKKRRIYSFSGLSVLLDKIAGLGSFVELAYEREAASEDAGRKKIAALFARLGIPASRVMEDSYYSLALKKLKR